MNKRTNIFYITTVVVAIVCLILDLIFTDLSFSFLGICFALTMLAYGICLIARGLHFKIDSSLFLGVAIFVFGVISVITSFTQFSYLDLWHYLLLGLSGASAITGLYFKIVTQKKLSLLFLGLFVLAFLFQINTYNIWIMLLTMFIWVIAFIVANNILLSRRK